MQLQISKAAKSFGSKIIFNDLSLTINTGEVLGLFGRNGTGKSTLLKIIFGVLQPDSLLLKIDHQSVSAKSVIKERLIAYLPQDRFLPNQLSVRKIIPMYFQEEKVLDDLFYAPGIAAMETLPYGKLSEGQKKYLELLLLSHLDHPFMMLDEPFSMIDPKHKDLIKGLLSSLKRTKGILVTDHYYQDVLDISGRNYLIKDGTIHLAKGEKELRQNGYLPKRQ